MRLETDGSAITAADERRDLPTPVDAHFAERPERGHVIRHRAVFGVDMDDS